MRKTRSKDLMMTIPPPPFKINFFLELTPVPSDPFGLKMAPWSLTHFEGTLFFPTDNSQMNFQHFDWNSSPLHRVLQVPLHWEHLYLSASSWSSPPVYHHSKSTSHPSTYQDLLMATFGRKYSFPKKKKVTV